MTDVHQARTTRRGLLAGTGAVAGATALGGPAAAAHAGDRGGGGLASDDWPRGPGARIRPQRADAELRAMLRRDRPRPHRGERPQAGVVRHPAHAVRARTTRSVASARPATGSSRSASVRRGVRRADDGRAAVVRPAGRRRPDPRGHQDHQRRSRRCAATSTPNRTYVVSGHYDSRVTDVMNATDDAPGADDDASGVAVCMELARVMATHHSRGHDRLRRRRRRGAGPVRVDVHGRAVQGRRRRTSRACSPTTSSAAARADDGTARPPRACGCSPRARRPARTPRPRRCGSPSAARTTRPRATWRVS